MQYSNINYWGAFFVKCKWFYEIEYERKVNIPSSLTRYTIKLILTSTTIGEVVHFACVHFVWSLYKVNLVRKEGV